VREEVTVPQEFENFSHKEFIIISRRMISPKGSATTKLPRNAAAGLFTKPSRKRRLEVGQFRNRSLAGMLFADIDRYALFSRLHRLQERAEGINLPPFSVRPQQQNFKGGNFAAGA
jgi:hypothetical protein